VPEQGHALAEWRLGGEHPLVGSCLEGLLQLIAALVLGLPQGLLLGGGEAREALFVR
jgi:hypothetical protein